MKKLKYVVYGAGNRGRRLFDYWGDKQVAAFIDSNSEKIGKEFCGKPIIGLDTYKTEYADSFIIISAYLCETIISKLVDEGIFQFTPISEMPSEFIAYSYNKFEECYKDLKQQGKKYVIYGLNAFSLILYEYLCTDSEICIVPENKDNKIACWLQREHPEIALAEPECVDGTELLLVTVRKIEPENADLYEKNVKINMLEYLDNSPFYYHKELEQFKGMFQDRKRCFITATGPSMNARDLETLRTHNEFCIGVNSLCLYESLWKPDVFVVTDALFWENHKEDILGYAAGRIFIPDAFRYIDDRRDDIYLFHLIRKEPVDETDMMVFSENICQKIFGHGTVVYACIQLAVYFGFKEIYLLGVDCNYVPGSRNNHFIPDKGGDTVRYEYKKSDREENMRIDYKIAKKYADSHGIKIYNATRGGMLEVFERVDFDSLF